MVNVQPLPPGPSLVPTAAHHHDSTEGLHAHFCCDPGPAPLLTVRKSALAQACTAWGLGRGQQAPPATRSGKAQALEQKSSWGQPNKGNHRLCSKKRSEPEQAPWRAPAPSHTELWPQGEHHSPHPSSGAPTPSGTLACGVTPNHMCFQLHVPLTEGLQTPAGTVFFPKCRGHRRLSPPCGPSPGPCPALLAKEGATGPVAQWPWVPLSQRLAHAPCKRQESIL